jgi:hypothetical protein
MSTAKLNSTPTSNRPHKASLLGWPGGESGGAGRLPDPWFTLAAEEDEGLVFGSLLEQPRVLDTRI